MARTKKYMNVRLSMAEKAMGLGEPIVYNRRPATGYDLFVLYREHFRGMVVTPYHEMPSRLRSQFEEMARRINLYNNLFLETCVVLSGPIYRLEMNGDKIVTLISEYQFIRPRERAGQTYTSRVQFNLDLEVFRELARDRNPFQPITEDSKVA